MDEKIDEAYKMGFEEGVRHAACARGMWVRHTIKYFEGLRAYKCSICGHIRTTANTPYCPMCGAKMEGEEE